MRVVIVAILFFLNLTFMYAVETSGEKFQPKIKSTHIEARKRGPEIYKIPKKKNDQQNKKRN